MGSIIVRKPAVLAMVPRDRHAVIEASAGTGKTYTIEHLFIDLLLEREVTVENILVLTYTEKAAGELRQRVRAIVQRILDEPGEAGPATADHWVITDALRLKLKQSLFSFDKAPIHTIHGFFQRVITEHAFTSGRLFDQQLIDTRTLFGEVFRQALRTHYARDANLRPLLSAWMERQEGSVGDLEDLLYRVYVKKCRLLPAYDPPALLGRVRALSALLSGDPGLEGLKAACRRATVNGSTTNALIRKIKALGEQLDACRTVDNLVGLLVSLDHGALTYIDEKLSAAAPASGPDATLFRDFLGLTNLGIGIDAAVVQSFLSFIDADMQRRKREEGLYDFDDMIGYLRQALAGPQAEALLESLRSRYRYALIDESQDTDENQWEIFRTVFCESGGRNIICLIGDPKQAIYGFRGADVATYLKARTAICGDDRPVSLAGNYRSTARLIEAYNIIFDQTAAPPFFDGQIRYDVPVACGEAGREAFGAEGRPIVPIVIVQVPPDPETGKVSSPAYRRKMGRYIADEISGILRDPARAIILRDRSAGTQVSARDIFILTRSEQEGRDLAEHLRVAGVPFAFYKQDGLFQTREAREIRDLLAAIAQPAHQSRRFRAWLTAFFGVPLGSLSSCRDLPDAEALMAVLNEWHGIARDRDYPRLFTKVLDESGIVRRELFYRDSERQLTNYFHIFEILLEEVAAAPRDIAELAALMHGFVEKTRVPARDNGNIQRLETEKDAVQIMTLHKSKGLEAPVVFLYGGFTTPPAGELRTFHDGGTRSLYIGPPPSGVLAAAGREAAEEHQRLLYVGVTRAKARLYLPYIERTEDGKPGTTMQSGPYHVLNDRILRLAATGTFGDHAELFALVRAGGVPAPQAAGEGADDASVADATREAHADLPPEDQDRLDYGGLRQAHRGYAVTSYTTLKQMGEHIPVSRREREFDEWSDRRAAEGPGGPDFGAAIHAVMERIDFGTVAEAPTFEAWAALPAVAALFREVLQAYGVDPAHLDLSRRLVHGALTTAVDLGGGAVIPSLASAEQHAREVEFLYPYPEAAHPRLAVTPAGGFEIDRGFVRGFIDLVFRHEGRFYLLDWKTDRLDGYGREELGRHVEAQYGLQQRLYLIALVKMIGAHSRDAYGRLFGGILYCFVRGMGPGAAPGGGVCLLVPTWEDLESYERELIERTEAIVPAGEGA